MSIIHVNTRCRAVTQPLGLGARSSYRRKKKEKEKREKEEKGKNKKKEINDFMQQMQYKMHQLACTFFKMFPG